MVRFVFTGGGTGGHTFPVIAVIRELKRIFEAQSVEYEFLFVGPRDDFTPVILVNEQIKARFIPAGKMRRYFSWKNFVDVFKAPLGIAQALWILWAFMPDAVFSKGGYGSFPVVFAAWLLRIPALLHESDAIPGRANTLLARFAKKIAISFEDTRGFSSKKIVVIGNPIRTELFLPPEGESPLGGLDPARKTILVLGGSQGARRVNDFILSVLPQMLVSYQVIHQCGENNFDEVAQAAKAMIKPDDKKHFYLFPFLNEEELRFAYALSDVVVSRAGAGSIFEIAAAGKPSIIIPLSSSAQDHQRVNAYRYADKGTAVVLEEENLLPNLFLEKINEILEQTKLYDRMAEAARAFSKPNAAHDIAVELLKLI